MEIFLGQSLHLFSLQIDQNCSLKHDFGRKVTNKPQNVFQLQKNYSVTVHF